LPSFRKKWVNKTPVISTGDGNRSICGPQALAPSPDKNPWQCRLEKRRQGDKECNRMKSGDIF